MHNSTLDVHDLTIWSNFRKIAFRFSFLSILSFIVLVNNGTFYFLTYFIRFVNKSLYSFVPWFAEHILHYHYDYSIYSNGSGDTSYNWVLLLLLIIFSIFGTLIWSVLDRNRRHYKQLYYWLTVIIRYYIAFTLIQYGLIKIIKLQFPDPSLVRLTQPLGAFSPMGLAWTFLGFSKGYNMFMGIAEVLAGLLLFKRTLLLGAFIALATSINIMTVNYFYDIPVKMLSTALVILCIYLILPYITPLYKFIIQQKLVQLPKLAKPKYKKVWINKMIPIFKYLLLLSFLYIQFNSVRQNQKMMHTYFGEKSLFYGIYEPDSNAKQTLIPPEWNEIIFEHQNQVHINDQRNKTKAYVCQIDDKKKELTINNNIDKYQFHYSRDINGDLILVNINNKQGETIRLRKRKIAEIELLNRPFRWISEYPYHR
ncbi:hypothetical protein ACFX5U_11725 [Sphingobacterium sp. SG20118]|uniref:hypothetical protein n=1 Tax=Sphingobacterium sp. SG20118 TaxID=3367156 RepID=UPI0037DFC764